VAMIASHLRLPVVPIRIKGLERVLHRTAKFPTPGRVDVHIGAPIFLTGESFADQAHQVEEAVKAL
jgi:1-acyl-sn-glycerol-3-phosphate acyltransferase